MKRVFWNLAVAWHLWNLGRLPILIGVRMAASDDDAYNDGLTALETAQNEISYWEE